MKRNLLTWNVIFYAILYSASLWYVGYVYGEHSQSIYPLGPEYFVFPAIHLAQLIAGIFFLRNWEYGKRRGYYVMGAITVAYSCLLLGTRLFFYSQGRMVMDSQLDIYVYPGTVFLVSILIGLFYFICAAKTERETEFR